eukprot:1017348-Amphidinium_carterae.1
METRGRKKKFCPGALPELTVLAHQLSSSGAPFCIELSREVVLQRFEESVSRGWVLSFLKGAELEPGGHESRSGKPAQYPLLLCAKLPLPMLTTSIAQLLDMKFFGGLKQRVKREWTRGSSGASSSPTLTTSVGHLVAGVCWTPETCDKHVGGTFSPHVRAFLGFGRTLTQSTNKALCLKMFFPELEEPVWEEGAIAPPDNDGRRSSSARRC